MAHGPSARRPNPFGATPPVVRGRYARRSPARFPHGGLPGAIPPAELSLVGWVRAQRIHENLLTLSGGITDDHVFISITGVGQSIGGNTNGGAVHGVFVFLNDKINLDNTV